MLGDEARAFAQGQRPEIRHEAVDKPHIAAQVHRRRFTPCVAICFEFSHQMWRETCTETIDRQGKAASHQAFYLASSCHGHKFVPVTSGHPIRQEVNVVQPQQVVRIAMVRRAMQAGEEQRITV